MIKFICIKVISPFITLHKIYSGEISIMSTRGIFCRNYEKYYITADDGNIRVYDDEHLMPLAKWREIQINTILD